MAKKVTVIEPTQKHEVIEDSQLRVCAYCRVSSMHEQQQNSFAAQVTHYTQYINNNPNWNFVGIYADEGISGTSKEKRTDFIRLINDCECGLIDLVITKSISRFARNTADCIEVVRKLKEMGIGVFFEKENINTLSEESELILSILSSIAQEEMISLSKNIRWANQRRYSQGKFQVAPKKFLGYDVDPISKKLVINEKEAQIVRRIFKEYIEGKGTSVVAKILNAEGIPTITGTIWWGSTITRMLKNEKYCGDVLMQKTITADEITFKRKINRGEQPQYYIKDDHEPIISREVFELAQKLMAENSRAKGMTEEVKKKSNNRYPFTSKMLCGKCGKVYRRTIQNSNTAHSRPAWACMSVYHTVEKTCGNGSIHEDRLIQICIGVLKKLYSNIDTLLIPYADTLKAINQLDNNHEIQLYDLQIQELLKQMNVLAELASKGTINPILFNTQNNEILSKINECKKKRQQVADKHYANTNNLKDTERIIERLKSTHGFISTLEKVLLDDIVDKIIVYSRKRLVFKLINGIELVEEIGD